MTDPSNPTLAIGIDFGGTSVKLGVCRGPELLELAEPIPTEGFTGVDDLMAAIVDLITELRERHPGITCIGAGVPGFVDFPRGFIHSLTNVPGWDNVPFKRLMEEKTGLPVTVENDANAMAWAEWSHGAARGHRNVVCVTLGTGVGGALILNGQLYRGSHFGAGEIGQMSIHYSGKAGNYGNLGALEKYVGNNQITEHAILRYAEIGEARKKEDCTPRHIAEAAQAGDDIARQIWGDVGLWLGSALTSIVWVLNPDAIVIGGGVAKAGDLLFEPLKHRMQSMLNPVFWEDLDIVKAHFGNEAGIIGCAALAADESSYVDGDGS